MANGFSSFAQDHHYASGIILATIGVVGVVGSVTGNLPSMLAALWVPDILITSSGAQAASGSLPSLGSLTNEALNPLNNPTVNPAAGLKILQGPLKWLTS